MPDEPPKRPVPPEKVDNPLPHLAEAMKKLGEMQVSMTKAVEELDQKRQAEYIAACKAFDSIEADKKAKEQADKEKSEYNGLKWEVARLKRKIESRPGKPDPETCAMAVPSVIARVLQHDDFDKANLKNFCLISKAWVVPCRTLLFLDLSNLVLKTRARVDGLVELFMAKKALAEVVKTMSFQFTPPDPASPKQVALREALPSPIQMMLILSAAINTVSLEFLNMGAFGATQAILRHYSHRIEKFTLDPQGYAWHGREVDFGTISSASILADWPVLKELSLTRIVLRVENPHGRGQQMPAQCPLTTLRLEKIRLFGYIYHILEGSLGKLTRLTLRSISHLTLRDISQTLNEHGATLTHLTLIGTDIVDSERHGGGHGGGWEDSDGWGSGGGNRDSRTSMTAFDNALSACVALTHLSIEPGRCMVLRPESLFEPLSKLEELQFTKRNCNTYDRETWMLLLGLGPVLVESKRKLKKISFGHDWGSDDRRVEVLQTQWKKFSDEVKVGRMPSSS